MSSEISLPTVSPRGMWSGGLPPSLDTRPAYVLPYHVTREHWVRHLTLVLLEPIFVLSEEVVSSWDLFDHQRFSIHPHTPTHTHFLEYSYTYRHDIHPVIVSIVIYKNPWVTHNPSSESRIWNGVFSIPSLPRVLMRGGIVYFTLHGSDTRLSPWVFV